MIENPIHQRLLLRGKVLNRESSRRLSIVLAITTGLPPLAALILDPGSQTLLMAIPIIMVGIAAGIIFLSPPLIMMLTAVLTAREVVHEDFAYLKLTNVTPEQIIQAYLNASSSRLEMLWAVCRGIVPGLLIALTHYQLDWVACTMTKNCLSDLVEAGILDLLASAFALTIVSLYLLMLWRLALRAGIWSAVRWGHNAPIAAGSMFVVAIALGIGLAFAATIAVLGVPLLCTLPTIGLPLVCLALNDFFMRSMLQAIERR